MLRLFKYTSYIIILLGALNWGSVGVFEFNLVSYLLGCKTRETKAVYALVGLSALISILTVCLSCACKKKEHESLPVELNI